MDARFYPQKSAAVTAAIETLRGWGYPDAQEGADFEIDEADAGWWWFSEREPIKRPN